MQFQKNEIRTQILDVAREEFIKNGVKRTSMQSIASRVGIAASNIYNYFKGKDDLLKDVLAPLFKAFAKYREQNRCADYTTLDIFRYDTYYRMMHHQVTSLVIPYRKEFSLLIFDTDGTSLEGCFKRLQDRNVEDGLEYIRRMRELHPDITTDISPLFVRILCELWGGLIKSIVTNEDITEQELDRIISNYVRFGIGGWKNLMGVE